MTNTIRVTRSPEGFGALRRVQLRLDGAEVGTLHLGETLEIPATAGSHRLEARMDWVSGSAEITVGSEPVHLTVSAGGFLRGTLGSLWPPARGSFFRFRAQGAAGTVGGGVSRAEWARAIAGGSLLALALLTGLHLLLGYSIGVAFLIAVAAGLGGLLALLVLRMLGSLRDLDDRPFRLALAIIMPLATMQFARLHFGEGEPLLRTILLVAAGLIVTWVIGGSVMTFLIRRRWRRGSG